jgi:hypothetical protein
MADAVIEDLLQLLTAGFGGPTQTNPSPLKMSAYWVERSCRGNSRSDAIDPGCVNGALGQQ